MDIELPPQRRIPNSTSSLYIESTIAHPDLLEVCFCVSLVVHDLIVEGEASLAARTGGSSAEDDPFSLFRPREIFQLASKRSRSVFEAADVSDGGGSSSSSSMLEPTRRAGGASVESIPTEEDIRASIAEVHSLAHFSPGCLVVALIYMERLRRGAGALLLVSTWQPTLLIAILVAQKVWEDHSALSVDYTRLHADLTVKQINTLERDFLRLIDYNVGVKSAVYANWYFRLGTLCERNQMRMRPLDGNEALALEIGSDQYASRIKAQGNRPNSGPLPSVEGTPGDRTPATPGSASRAVIS